MRAHVRGNGLAHPPLTPHPRRRWNLVIHGFITACLCLIAFCTLRSTLARGAESNQRAQDTISPPSETAGMERNTN